MPIDGDQSYVLRAIGFFGDMKNILLKEVCY